MAKQSTPKVVTKKHLARLEQERIKRRYLIIGSIVIAVLVVGVILFGILDQTVLKSRKPVAKVGDQIITVADLQKQVYYYRWNLIKNYEYTYQMYQFFGNDPTFSAQIQSQLEQISSQLSAENATVLGSTALEQLIDAKIIEREAKARGITITDEEIEKSMQEAFGFYANGTPTPAPTSTTFATSTLSPLQLTLIPPTATLPPTPTLEASPTMTAEPTATPTIDPSLPTNTPEPTSTPYTLEGYKNRVAEYIGELKELGFSESDLREIFRRELLKNKVYEAITADIQPKQEQVWARHILVDDEGTAKALLDRIKKGEDWGKLAAEYSTDTSNKDKGGDLGWFGRGMMVKEFEDTAFQLEVGQISQPVKTQFGWHLIQLLGKDVRPLSQSQLQNLKDQKFDEWLQTQRDGEDIERYDLWETVIPTEPTFVPQF
ncbi:MAG: peptidylprolyl isomerase [Anaerolineales bacterium]